MKALTLTQPWASLVVLGEKQIETRSWKPSAKMESVISGQTIAIHAAQSFPQGAKEMAIFCTDIFYALGAANIKYLRDLPTGAIVGTVEYLGFKPTEEIHLDLTDKERSFGDYAPNRFGWYLKNARMFEAPIKCKGALSLWQVPEDVEAQILSAKIIV